MTKEEMISELRSYLKHIAFASDCMAAYKSLLDACEIYNDQINCAPGFFSVTLHSLSKTLCIELSKLFVGNGREKNLKKLISLVKENYMLFPAEKAESYEWVDEPMRPPQLVYYKIDITQDICEAEAELASLNPIIMNLRNRRNKFLAHNDPAFFDGKRNPAFLFPITMNDVQLLISFSGNFCNKLLSYLSDTVMVTQSSNADDLRVLLDRVALTDT